MQLSIIVAASKNNAIGKNNQLLWHMPADLKFFKSTTSGHSVIMGRKTFESVGKALPKRRNIVVTKNESYSKDNIETAASIEDAIDKCKDEDEVFIIGGAALYKEALKCADKIYLTRIHHHFNQADVFFPELDENEWLVDYVEHHESNASNPYDYTFYTYIKNQ